MHTWTRSRLARAIWAAVLLMTASFAPAYAQSTTDGAIGGVVLDTQQATVPGATVSVRNIATNSTADTTTDVNGRFLATHLQPGTYSVEVSLSGFAPYKRDNVIVEVGRATNLDVTLGVAGQTERVEVTAQAPIISTEQSDVSTNINQTTIANLPTNTRRWSTFALTTPGAAPDGSFGLVSFRGISGLLNSNSVDGADNTQAFFAEERGRTRLAYSVSMDAIREFQVTTSNYSAEYGRAAGGVVNAVTKSGSNDVHGSAFYFIRDNKWGATNPFQTQTVLQNGVSTVVQLKPKDRRQQFGGTVGGPIQKDRVFFFFSYDQQARTFPGVAAPSNPSAFFAPFSAAELTAFASRGISPSQQAEGLAFLQGLTGTVDRTGDQTLFLPKIDWKINNSNTFSATYNRLRWDSPAGVQTAAVVFRGTENWGDDGVHEDWTTERLLSAFGTKMTNEAKFQWGRDFEFQKSQPPLPGEPVSAAGTAPNVVINGAGGITFGKPDFLERRAYPDERRIDVGDAVSVVAGTHLFKVGGDISRVSDTLDSLFQEGGSYTYNNRVDFISDWATRNNSSPLRTYASFNQGIGPTAFKFRTIDYDAYVQDTWHANEKTTLNLGLRYDYEQLPQPQIANPLLPASSQFPKDKNNFGPRLGVVYDVTGHGSTVVRGGYGIFYGRIINSTISNAITNVGSLAGQIQLTFLPTAAGAPAYPNILSNASGTLTRPDVVVFAPDTQNPTVHEWDVILEQKIATNTVVSVSYVGSAGRNLPLFIDRNLPPPSGTITYSATGGGPLNGQLVTVPVFTGARPNPNFGRITEISDIVKSKYNGVVFAFNRRLTNGLQIQSNYTEARATDNGQASQTFTSSNNVLNPYDLGLEQGTSSFEVRHRFVANAIWMTSFGAAGTTTHALLSDFTISPSFVAASGQPWTASLTGNTPAAGRILTGVLGAGGTNRLPSIPRNSYYYPKTMDMSLRVARSFDLGGGHKIEGMVDIFNVFNRLNYTSVNTLMYTVGGTAAAPTLTYNPTFGTLNNANSNYFVFTPRQVQIAARYTF